MDEVVIDRRSDFPWLEVCMALHPQQDDGGPVRRWRRYHYQTAMPIQQFGCDVTEMTITDMSLETVIHQLARVYDLHTGLASSPFAWGAAQLYFASKYPRCVPVTDQHGAEVLGRHDAAFDRAARFFELLPGPGMLRDCRGTPSSEAERVVRQALDGDVPDWYYNNITTASQNCGSLGFEDRRCRLWPT